MQGLRDCQSKRSKSLQSKSSNLHNCLRSEDSANTPCIEQNETTVLVLLLKEYWSPDWSPKQGREGCGSQNLYTIAVVTLYTDFYLGKTDLPRYLGQIHQKFLEVNSSRVLFYLGKKFWEGHTTDISSQGFHGQLNFLERKFKKARCAGIWPIKETFFSFINGRKRRRLVPENFFHRVSYVQFCHQGLCR